MTASLTRCVPCWHTLVLLVRGKDKATPPIPEAAHNVGETLQETRHGVKEEGLPAAAAATSISVAGAQRSALNVGGCECRL